METKLSILIPTIPDRKNEFQQILDCLNIQSEGLPIEIISHRGTKEEISIGKKRQELLEEAKGEYVAWFDDDDTILPNYISSIMKALESNPDCVDINIIMLTNGMNPEFCFHHLKNKVWHSSGGCHYRNITPFNPIKRELALQVGFKDMRYREDHDYANKITPLCKTSVLIPEFIYVYNFSNKQTVKEKFLI